MEQLLNKPYVNEVILRGQSLFLKYLQPLELLTNIEKGVRSFYTLDIRSAKLPSIKIQDDSTLGRVKPWLKVLAHTLTVMAKLADFF